MKSDSSDVGVACSFPWPACPFAFKGLEVKLLPALAFKWSGGLNLSSGLVFGLSSDLALSLSAGLIFGLSSCLEFIRGEGMGETVVLSIIRAESRALWSDKYGASARFAVRLPAT